MLACGWPSRAAPGDEGGRIDLLAALARADVCPGAGEHCWPEEVSTGLHRAPATPELVVLPPRASSDLYVRVPAGGLLSLEFSDGGSPLALRSQADDGRERELYRSPTSPDVGRWQTADIPLGDVAGKVVRLRLVAEAGPRPDGDRAGILVRSATLRGESLAAPPSALPRSHRPNVIVYVIDTLRADHLGCYGYRRPTTPRIDAFAASAVRFTAAIAQSSWTLPATASILTGLVPGHHGAIDREHGIRSGVATLAEALPGYQTTAFVTNYLGSAIFGHARGFERFHFYAEQGERRAPVYLGSDALYRRIARWLARGPRQPFLLYVHASDPHFPYLPPPRMARPFLPRGVGRDAVRALVDRARPFYLGNERWGTRPPELSDDEVRLLGDLYDGDVRTADTYFGRLMDDLARNGLLDDTLVVLTADHGEEFLEHGGVAHGQTLYREVLRVPLLVRLPGGAQGGTRVDRVVRQVDIFPTVLDLLGLPPRPWLDGTSLVTPAPGEGEAYSVLHLGGFDVESLSTLEWKAIHNFGGRPRFELYRLLEDPGEQRDVAAASPVALGYARVRLPELGTVPAPGARVDPQRLARLRALGYAGD